MYCKSKIGILLAVLVMVLFFPDLSVVQANEEEEEEPRVPPYLGPHDPDRPFMEQWEELEVLDVAMMGEYDTSWGIPQWVTDIIEMYTTDRNDIAHKEPCREQYQVRVLRTEFRGKERIAITDTPMGHSRRGLFATFKDIATWEKSMKDWFLWRKVVYVDCEMRETHSTIGCTYKFRVVSPESKYVKEKQSAFRGAPYYFEQDWDEYHLFVKNCQHYNDWVLTGIDHSQ